MQNDDDTNSKEKPAETADKTNMEFNDDASSASSSSSEQKLKIDIDEDTDSNAKSTNETARNSIQVKLSALFLPDLKNLIKLK